MVITDHCALQLNAGKMTTLHPFEATYRKEDPLHLQDFTGHNRAHFLSAVLAHPSMLCWFLSTWLDNERIWPPGSRVCLTAFLIVIHSHSAEFWPALLHMIVSDPRGSFEHFSHLGARFLDNFWSFLSPSFHSSVWCLVEKKVLRYFSLAERAKTHRKSTSLLVKRPVMNTLFTVIRRSETGISLVSAVRIKST